MPPRARGPEHTLPYRIDVRCPPPDAFDRLVDAGALDVDIACDGTLSALLPDRIPLDAIANALGAARVTASAAIGRDADSIWLLAPRRVRAGRLDIVPAHLDAGPGALRLLDSPAFGTGLHPTTTLCLEALSEIVPVDRPARVLDVGTGSGVLALAALRLGVPHAHGCDVDDAALRAAASNARLNALDDRLTLTTGGPETLDGTWPLVLANVLAAPLIEMAPALARRVGHEGQLVLSGIPAAVEPAVDTAYRRLGMHRIATASHAGWVALTLRASW